MAFEKNVHKGSFVTGQNVKVTLFIDVGGVITPLINIWDKLDIEVQIKSKKNRSIGISTSRTQTSIEGYRLTLSKAKQDALVDIHFLMNQTQMMAYQPNIEYIVRLEIIHSYQADQLQAAADDGNPIFKEIVGSANKALKSITKAAITEGQKFLSNQAASAANAVQNYAQKEINKEMQKQSPQVQRAARFVGNQLGVQNIKPAINKATQGLIKSAGSILRGQVDNLDIGAALGIFKEGNFNFPYKEVYDFQFCSLTAGSTNFEPKEISRHGITFESAFMECSTVDNMENKYQYNQIVKMNMKLLDKFSNEFKQEDRDIEDAIKVKADGLTKVIAPNPNMNEGSLQKELTDAKATLEHLRGTNFKTYINLDPSVYSELGTAKSTLQELGQELRR